MLKEICPDLAEEIIQDQEKKEPCKKCHDKVGQKYGTLLTLEIPPTKS